MHTFDQSIFKSAAEMYRLHPCCEPPEGVLEILDLFDSPGRVVVLSGEEIGPESARDLMQKVIRAEIADWNHGPSQRLIRRTAAALGLADASDVHHTDPPQCPEGECITSGTWLARMPIMVCEDCHRIYPA